MHLKKIYWLQTTALSALLALTANSAASEPINNKKNAITESSKAWLKEPNAVFGIKIGNPLADSQIQPCPEKSYESKSICLITSSYKTNDGKPIYSVGGHPFDYAGISINIDEIGVVSDIQARMSHDRFHEFVAALISRYGEPTLTANEEIQTKSGGKYKNQTLTWTGKHLTITALERVTTITDSYVVFSDNQARQRYAEKKLKKLQSDSNTF